MTDLRRPIPKRAPGADPGEDWTEELLSPLRRVRVDLDVAPLVMARVAAARRGAPLPSFLERPRLAWASAVAAGVLLFLGLSSALVGTARSGEGIRQATAVASALGRVSIRLYDMMLRIGGGLESVSAPLLRALGTLLDVAAPLLRGAGLVSAGAGLLSILISLYVFASARATAPQTGGRGAIPHGGTR
jgi:hypothetical protein